jgi:hypothetical protein
MRGSEKHCSGSSCYNSMRSQSQQRRPPAEYSHSQVQFLREIKRTSLRLLQKDCICITIQLVTYICFPLLLHVSRIGIARLGTGRSLRTVYDEDPSRRTHEDVTSYGLLVRFRSHRFSATISINKSSYPWKATHR